MLNNHPAVLNIVLLVFPTKIAILTKYEHSLSLRNNDWLMHYVNHQRNQSTYLSIKRDFPNLKNSWKVNL